MTKIASFDVGELLAGLFMPCLEKNVEVKTDKFSPEAACVIGNYYSLRGEHDKAVQYFRRAITLDRLFIPAWILMGHECALEQISSRLIFDGLRKLNPIRRSKLMFALSRILKVFL